MNPSVHSPIIRIDRHKEPTRNKITTRKDGETIIITSPPIRNCGSSHGSKQLSTSGDGVIRTKSWSSITPSPSPTFLSFLLLPVLPGSTRLYQRQLNNHCKLLQVQVVLHVEVDGLPDQGGAFGAVLLLPFGVELGFCLCGFLLGGC